MEDMALMVPYLQLNELLDILVRSESHEIMVGTRVTILIFLEPLEIISQMKELFMIL